jgi:4'-phosphopantetheinyl transferase
MSWEGALLGPELPPREVHVWRANADGWSGLHDDLSDEERSRAVRFRFDKDRRRWVAARTLVRWVLARYLGVEPTKLVLGADANGRPLVLSPPDADWLCFSLSHAGDVAVVAVTRDRRVGVDVELVRSGLDVVAVAQRAFGEAVASELACEGEARRTQRFFEVWTREEARGKCRGTGLIEPEDPRQLDVPAVIDLQVGEGYAGALAGAHRPEDVRRCTVAL